MALSPQHKAKLAMAAGRSLGGYIAWVDRTSRVVSDPPDAPAALRAGHPAIVASWHGQFMMLVTQWPKELRVGAMVARHGDAELIGKALGRYNVELIRGAGAGQRKRDRGGAQALRAAVKALQSGVSFVMTADVPPGPARRCGEGIILLARLSGRPILPVAAASSRYHALKTWSRMTINMPYSTMGYVVGSPIFVPADADAQVMERKRLEVEASLNAATQRAYSLAGADPARATPPAAGAAGNGRGKFKLAAYRTGTSLMRPLAPLLLGIRERQGKEDARRRGERFGQANAARPAGAVVWVHAASVGETNAVLPLIHRLSQDRPELSFLLTTGTVTSAGLAAQRLPARALHQYIPLDAPEYVRAFLDHWKPDLAIFTESEIWPNLIIETAKRNVPLALVNGRMSQRSYKRWRDNAGFSRPLFSAFDLVMAQNDRLAERFGELGAKHVIAAGNLKIDSPPPPSDTLEVERLTAALAGRPVMIAASTHEGEETVIAEAHRRLAREIPGFCTIIAPRHPERGTGIAELLKSQGLSTAQRSTGALPAAHSDIYVADTIGELGTLYALSPVSFIGGSLIPHGGQNPIEAIRHGSAVLTGPHWQNFKDAYDTLLRHKGAIEIRSANELALQVALLIKDEERLQQMNDSANTALQVLGGALEKTLSALQGLLPPGSGLLRAS
ncbi:MAG: glycosyltransferase N-terminal domain-containing protein [Hyphomicrobiaceae bacterium]|nr:glycosyltransferase N-terminal domain-containing protein [Hyphomicrobiaceae bacterium]